MFRLIDAKLIKWFKSSRRKPLLLEGPRQVGKTYSLQALGDRLGGYAYLNFEQTPSLCKIFKEDLKPQKILQDIQLTLHQRYEPKTDLLILDEIQECPRALTALKYFCEDMPEVPVCAAGSLLGLSLGEEGSFPVGKVDILKMYPMTFFEFLKAVGEKSIADMVSPKTREFEISEFAHEKLWEWLKKYLIVGGLPEVVATFENFRAEPRVAYAEVLKIQGDLVNGYLADVAKHSGKENSMHIERIWKSIPAQLSQTHDGDTKKYKFLGVLNNPRYSQFAGPVDWLLKVGLIFKIPEIEKPYQPLSSQVKENRFKLFVFDIGILNYLNRTDLKSIIDFNYGTYKGFMMENFALQELTAYDLDPLYCWAENKASLEILIDVNSDVIPIEVKSGRNTRSKSLQVFRSKYDPATAVKLCAQQLYVDSKQGMVILPHYLIGRLSRIIGNEP